MKWRMLLWSSQTLVICLFFLLYSILYFYVRASSDAYILELHSVLSTCPALLWLSGTQRRRAKPHKRGDESTEDDKLETELDNGKKESNGTTDNGVEPVARKRPKRAAACSNFKEKALDLSEKDSVVTNQIEEEIEAVWLTKTGPEDQRPCRKLIDFVLHDGDGNLQPFEMSEVDGIFITALVMPLDDDLEKDRVRGIRCIIFGRIEGWAISGYHEGAAVIWVSTELADYKCVKPASSYRSYFDHFSEKARVCRNLYKVS